MVALSALISGDEPTWDSIDDEIRIPLDRKSGVWIVNVEFNNMHETKLVLDSGASFTTLSENLAFELGLTPDPYLPKIPLNTHNGKIQAWVAKISSVRLDETERNNILVAVTDLEN